MSLYIQFFTFFMMLVSGWVLGLLYDVVRVVSKPLQLGRWFIALLDILYWCMATGIVFYMLLHSNQGEVRFYIFVGLLLGAWLYFLVASKLMVRIMEYMIHLIQKLVTFTIKCIQILIIKPLLLLYRFLLVLWGLITALTIFLGKTVVQCVYPIWKWLRGSSE